MNESISEDLFFSSSQRARWVQVSVQLILEMKSSKLTIMLWSVFI